MQSRHLSSNVLASSREGADRDRRCWWIVGRRACSPKVSPSSGGFRKTARFTLACLLFLAAGCVRTSEPQHVATVEVQKLDPLLQAEIRDLTERRCGTVSDPKMLGDASHSAESLRFASGVYARRCASCHGVSGDGNGIAAKTLNPKPRDYRKGIFKFTSTPYGQRPLREDLVRTVRRGIPGTSMPSFELLPQKELDAVVDYVKLLAMRGEFEAALALEAPEHWEDAIAEARGDAKNYDPQEAKELFRKSFTDVANEAYRAVPRRWEKAKEQKVTPETPQPILTEERVVRGRRYFLDQAAGCQKCHGVDGRGQTPENLRGDLKDGWGHPTQAADLTSGMLRGGSDPVDIYRRIHSGISGTPMPGFSSLRKSDEIWDLVAFVLYVSNERRRGHIPGAATGPMPRSAATTTATPSEDRR